MKNHKYKLNILTGEGFYDLIKALKAYEKNLKAKSKKLLERLADEGYNIASAGFESAQYDGTNDVKVYVEDRGDKAKALIASGNSALFIEFGTGIKYTDPHPEADKHGMVRAGYGQGKGKNYTWGYYGEPGTNGKVQDKKKDDKSLVTTHGNPANMPMYHAVEELKRKLPEIVREVFEND